MNYAYVRISSGKQETKTQTHTIEVYCKERGIVPDEWVIEQVSGGKRAADRQLGALLNRMQKGDLLVTTEISRLGRSTLNVMSTLNFCMEQGIRVWTIKGGYCLEDNIASKVLAFAFSLGAEIERDMIRGRTREAIARKRAEGKTWGRQKGHKSSTYKLTGREDEIRAMIAQNKPVLHIANELKIDRRTVSKFIKSKIL